MSDENTNSGEDVEIVSIGDETVEAASENTAEGETVSAAELEKSKNEYLYLRAEFDNFRKNSIKERAQLIKYGSEPMIRELLSVVDNFELALETEVTPETIESFKKGMELTSTELMAALTRFGIKQVNPKGEAFDPNQHDALSSEPTDSVPEGHITQVFKKAYFLHDKLIRPAQVVVAIAPPKTHEPKEEGES